MALPLSDNLLPTSYFGSPERVESDSELDITADCFHELNLMAGAEGSTTSIRKDCPDQKEKQILVDPISLGESLRRREASFNFMLPPIATAPDLPPPLPPLKTQMISFSLPNSACSSPRFSFALLKKKLKNESQASPRQIDSMARRYSGPPPCHLSMQEIHLRRSKSCREGRSCVPADELDLLFNQPNSFEIQHDKNLSKTNSKRDEHGTSNKMDSYTNDDGFKCGALCLYLPGFGKAKPVRPRKEIIEVEAGIGSVISRTVSLEKFECGSWASSAIVTERDDGEDGSMNLYFDLPLELIRTSVNDATAPVAAAFVFDKDTRVLKNSTTRKSHESTRHVRFSTSSPTSLPASPASCSSDTNTTRRLCKAREDFNAFLEAQNT